MYVHCSEATLRDVEAGLPRLREAEGAAAAAADHKREEVRRTCLRHHGAIIVYVGGYRAHMRELRVMAMRMHLDQH